jgi:hypothetical protein
VRQKLFEAIRPNKTSSRLLFLTHRTTAAHYQTRSEIVFVSQYEKYEGAKMFTMRLPMAIVMSASLLLGVVLQKRKNDGKRCFNLRKAEVSPFQEPAQSLQMASFCIRDHSVVCALVLAVHTQLPRRGGEGG